MIVKKFYIIFASILGIGLLITIAHVIYVCNVFENASIIQFIAREWWP